MKKLSVVLSAIVCAIFALATFTACDFFASEPDANTPYDAAVSEGYDGTRESWLSQVDGATTPSKQWYESYLQAVENGAFEGTFPEFLTQINENGTVVANTALTSVVSVYAFFPSSYSMGSGVIYSLDKEKGDALIVTNYHVVFQSTANEKSDDIVVYLYGNETFANNAQRGEGAIRATYVGGTMTYDLAVLAVTGANALKGNTYMRAAVAANSDAATVGETAYAVGNPVGMGLSVTRGIVSVTREEISTFTPDGKMRVTLPEIRTDAAINHGNSGGGLFNANGELIGIVNARLNSVTTGAQQEDTVEGFGYALPANFALACVQNILDNNGSLVVAQLGLHTSVTSRTTVFDEETAKFYIEEKIVVSSTGQMGGAGFLAGIRNGDTLLSARIVHADHTQEPTVALTREYKLSDLLLNIRKDDSLVVYVSRNGIILNEEGDDADEAKRAPCVVFSSATHFAVVA